MRIVRAWLCGFLCATLAWAYLAHLTITPSVLAHPKEWGAALALLSRDKRHE